MSELKTNQRLGIFVFVRNYIIHSFFSVFFYLTLVAARCLGLKQNSGVPILFFLHAPSRGSILLLGVSTVGKQPAYCLAGTYACE